MDSVPVVERHFTPNELAELWQLDAETVRGLFRDEPGVLRIGNRTTTRVRRAYTTLRIPASVAERVHRRLQNKTA